MNIHSSSGPRARNHPPFAAFFRAGETIEALQMKALSKAFLIGAGALALTASAASLPPLPLCVTTKAIAGAYAAGQPTVRS
jgi:hypothetical protein